MKQFLLLIVLTAFSIKTYAFWAGFAQLMMGALQAFTGGLLLLVVASGWESLSSGTTTGQIGINFQAAKPGGCSYNYVVVAAQRAVDRIHAGAISDGFKAGSRYNVIVTCDDNFTNTNATLRGYFVTRDIHSFTGTYTSSTEGNYMF